MQEDASKPSLEELLKFTLVGRKGMKEKGNYADGKSGIWVIKPSLGELLKFTSVGRKGMKEKGNYANGKSGIWVIYSLNLPIIYPITQT